MPTRVELLYDPHCPNVGLARAQLLRAFAYAGLDPHWRESRCDEGHVAEPVRPYGSPTILVDGRDVAPLTHDASCCRLYAQPDGSIKGVPSVEAIRSALTSHRGEDRNWASAGVWLPAIGIAALPKLICPACWPAYTALASTLGMPFLLQTRFLLPATLAALGVVLALLTWRAPQRRGYGPALVALAASAAIVAAKFIFLSPPAVYFAAAVLLIACIWNGWPRRTTCRDCTSSDERLTHHKPTDDRSSL